MAADDPSGGDAAPAGGQVGLLSDPVDVIIDKLLRCVSAALEVLNNSSSTREVGKV